MPHPILTEQPSFSKPIAVELNFTAARLMSQPEAKVREIFEGLHADIHSESFVNAMRFVMSLIMGAGNDLTSYINRHLGDICDDYIFDCAREKVPLFAWFFFNHLVEKKDGGFEVRQLNLDTLRAA